MENTQLPDPLTSNYDDIPAAIIKYSTISLQLSSALAQLASRLIEEKPKIKLNDDLLLNITEAAKILGVHENWLKNHKNKLPFVRRIGGVRGPLRFSKNGIYEWINRRK
jgi:hypothetical protein